MGFVVWYKLSFRPGTGGRPLLQVSNDLLSADLLTRSVLADADVTTDAAVGDRAATFKITLVDLPASEAEALAKEHRRSTVAEPMLVDIRLGYFDEPSTQKRELMTGAIRSVWSQVNGDGHLLTTIAGQEETGYRLLNQPFTFDQRDTMTLNALLDAVKRATGVDVVVSTLDGELTDHTVHTSRAMEALQQVAKQVHLPLTVGNGKAVLGDDLDAEQVTFSANTNLVTQGRRAEHPEDGTDAKATPVGMDTMTVLGDPALRVGTRVVMAPALLPDRTVSAVEHIFSLSSGYTCKVTTVEDKLTTGAVTPVGAAAFAERLSGRIRSTVDERPLVQVGDVTAYRPSGDGDHGGHRTTFTFSQAQPRDGTTTSVDSPTADDRTLHDKPLASPFAWDRCGLVVPVYPGMRSLLLHNRGELNDAVGAGFVWSRHAGHTPPQNEPGDYWLSLPTEVVDGRPTGKGVNDLTDATGHRVIQARALAIDVGEKTLTDVGTRPTSLPKDDTLVIAHSSGTTITVDAAGAITIQTSGKDIALGNGQASITISGNSITLAAKSVEVG